MSLARSFLLGGTAPAAFGSLVSLAAQALMALFLLRLFDPAAVGVYSLVAQIAFGWATLALAQSPLSLLANQHLAAMPTARAAWRASLLRWLWLAPLALLALAWAGARPATANTEAWPMLMPWTAATALAQMGWLLAQSLALRIHGPLAIAAVRMAPPVLAAALAGVGAWCLSTPGSALLLGAALSGYATGALWLYPLWGHDRATSAPPSDRQMTSGIGDARSERLKLVHSASDVLVATALASHWAALYGAAQAGCLLVLLRVFGFVPALVGSAWAQVVLSQPQARRPSSLLAATVGALGVAVLACGVALALQQGWLASSWQSLQTYVLPLALWQIAASIAAAVSHRPFQHGRARAFTWQCLGINAGQALWLLLPALWAWDLSAQLWGLCAWMALTLGTQALWSARLGR